MPITRSQKSELIASYVALIENSHAILVGEYRGISVPAMEKMRHALRDADAQFVVAKKTLMARALQEAGKPVPGEDLAAGAKILKDFVKETDGGFQLHGGVLGDSLLDANGALALADLPSREVQLAQLVGAIAGPLTALASLVSAPHRDLVSLLQARIDKEGGEAEAA